MAAKNQKAPAASVRKIDTFLGKTLSVGKIQFTVLDLCFVIVLCLFAFAARWYLYPLQSGDYKGFLSRWMQKIQQMGAFTSLGVEISNYTSPYMYLMCLVSGFSNSLYALKTVSVVFDYFGAFCMFLLVHQLTGSTRKGILGMACVLLCPTVILNSAWWCQCDMIYVSFILLALYFLFKDNSAACFLLLGVAFSFKVQTVFILPLVVILWLKNKTVNIWHLLLIPLMFVVLHIPAMIAGRPLSQLISVYFGQAGIYPWGTLKFPNLYEFLDETMKHKHHMQEVGQFGVPLAIMLLGTLAWYVASKRFKITDTFIVTLALFSVSLALYTLPHMHERYGYLVDMLVIVYALQRPEKTWVAVCYILISLITYMPFLVGAYVLPFPFLAAVLLALDVYVGYDLYRQMNIPQENAPVLQPGRSK